MAFVQLLSGSIEVEVDVKVFEEFSDGITIGVALLLDYLDKVFEGRSAAAVDYNCCGQVA